MGTEGGRERRLRRRRHLEGSYVMIVEAANAREHAQSGHAVFLLEFKHADRLLESSMESPALMPGGDPVYGLPMREKGASVERLMDVWNTCARVL